MEAFRMHAHPAAHSVLSCCNPSLNPWPCVQCWFSDTQRKSEHMPTVEYSALSKLCWAELDSAAPVPKQLGCLPAGSIIVRNNTVQDASHTWADVSPSGKPGFMGGASIAVDAAHCSVDEKPSGESCSADVNGLFCLDSSPLWLLILTDCNIPT